MKYLLSLTVLAAAVLSISVPVPDCSSAPPVLLKFTYINGTADTTTSATLCHTN